LVYEYMENGTLYDHLHNQTPSSPVTFEHLHCRAVPPVIHRDIKSANILLDSSWVPLLSDFGVSVHWDPTNGDDFDAVVGTLGYIDPEYAQTCRLKPAPGGRRVQPGRADARGSDWEEGVC
jgi:serine/threonine protein kinase